MKRTMPNGRESGREAGVAPPQREDFAELLGQAVDFTCLEDGERSGRGEVVEVKGLSLGGDRWDEGGAPNTGDGLSVREPFSVLLRLSTEARLVQGNYAVTHPRLGRLEIFMVPIGRDAAGGYLEAIFN